MLFGGASVPINSIIDISTIKAWKSVFDFDKDKLVARGIKTRFSLIYEATKHGLTPGTIFSSSEFISPIQDTLDSATALFTNVDGDNPIFATPQSSDSTDIIQPSVTQTT